MQHNKQTIIEGMKVLHKQMQAEGRTPQQIAEAFDRLNIITGINYWFHVNKLKILSRFDINNYMTGSGGRAKTQYLSGHHI